MYGGYGRFGGHGGHGGYGGYGGGYGGGPRGYDMRGPNGSNYSLSRGSGVAWTIDSSSRGSGRVPTIGPSSSSSSSAPRPGRRVRYGTYRYRPTGLMGLADHFRNPGRYEGRMY